MSSISGVLLSGLSIPKAPTLPWPPRVIKKKPSKQVLKIIRAHFLSVGNIQMPRKAKNTHTLKQINHQGVSLFWLCLFLCLRVATLNPEFYHLIQILS